MQQYLSAITLSIVFVSGVGGEVPYSQDHGPAFSANPLSGQYYAHCLGSHKRGCLSSGKYLTDGSNNRGSTECFQCTAVGLLLDLYFFLSDIISEGCM